MEAKHPVICPQINLPILRNIKIFEAEVLKKSFQTSLLYGPNAGKKYPLSKNMTRATLRSVPAPRFVASFLRGFLFYGSPSVFSGGF